MRDKEKKHPKGQESTIGKIIYGFLLFMPLIAIGVTCIVSTFNMSAKEETEITYKYETNEVNSIEDLVEGNIYYFQLDNRHQIQGKTISGYIKHWYYFNIPNGFDDNAFDEVFLTNQLVNNNRICHFELYLDEPNTLLLSYPDIEESHISFYVDIINNDLNQVSFDFVFIETNLNTQDLLEGEQMILKSDYNEIESVETHNVEPQEVFYHAVDKVTESPLFSWAQNSVIYTTTNTTCNALSITTPFIPLLLSYWLIISLIYFLYDIALMLVWLIHRKIHELQESL